MFKHVHVGILQNPHSKASVLAYSYISRNLEQLGMKVDAVTLDQLISGSVHADLFFNVFYGEVGDGGLVSGLLEQRGMPFVGNSQYASALMLNKVVAKKIFKSKGVPTPSFWYEPNISMSASNIHDAITDAVHFPMLAKPVNGAAAGGITLITSSSTLVSFIESHKTLISSGYFFFESFIEGIEITTGHIDFIEPILPVMELRLSDAAKNKDKFSAVHKEKIIPAQIPDSMYAKAQAIAYQLHEHFGCNFFSRVDFLYVPPEEQLYVLEINANPSFFERSVFMDLVKAAGVSETDFFEQAVVHTLQPK